MNCACVVSRGDSECRSCQEHGAVDHDFTMVCCVCEEEMCVPHLPPDCFDKQTCMTCLHSDPDGESDDGCNSVADSGLELGVNMWSDDVEVWVGPTPVTVPERPGPRRILPEWMRSRKRARVETTTRDADASEQDQSCSVCLRALGDHVACMPCAAKHAFHESCIGEWLKVSDTCPVCRGGPS